MVILTSLTAWLSSVRHRTSRAPLQTHWHTQADVQGFSAVSSCSGKEERCCCCVSLLVVRIAAAQPTRPTAERNNAASHTHKRECWGEWEDGRFLARSARGGMKLDESEACGSERQKWGELQKQRVSISMDEESKLLLLMPLRLWKRELTLG